MKLLSTLILVIVFSNVNAQNTFPTSGNVGIGITSSLTDPLTIKTATNGFGLKIKPSSSSLTTYLQLSPHPYYDYINQINSTSLRLDLISNKQIFLFADDIFFQGNAVVTRSNDSHPSSVASSVSSGTMPFETNLYNSSANGGIITYAGLQSVASTSVMGGHRIAFKMGALQSNLSDGKEVFNIQSDSTVGIGTTDTKHYRLAVNGAAIFTKVVVKNYSTWADYVFDESYKLPKLSDIEQFIKAHKHLPEMPTAAEVEKNGVDLGDTQVLLLKKVEELTLFLIEQNKKIEAQQKQIEILMEKR